MNLNDLLAPLITTGLNIGVLLYIFGRIRKQVDRLIEAMNNQEKETALLKSEFARMAADIAGIMMRLNEKREKITELAERVLRLESKV